MFDFIRKPFLWEAWQDGLDKEIGSTTAFHLKTIQDLAVYARLRGLKDATVAEIGGGDSRLLAKLSADNRCYNIEKFEGADGGPTIEKKIDGVENVKVFLGEFSDLLKPDSFDVVFSVSVVEHVASDQLDKFFEDGMRILKRGGLWLHAIDLYVEDEPDEYFRPRFEAYRAWARSPLMKAEGDIFDGDFRFTSDIATNPDNIMYAWSSVAPQLAPLRQRAQSASVLVASRKK